MMQCSDVREYLALHPAGDDPTLQTHLAGCHACECYRHQNQALDTALRTELQWQAPSALTARLLMLATSPQPVPQPKKWYVTLVYLLTLMVISLSVAIAWQLASILVAEVGITAALAQLAAAPGMALAQLTSTLPEIRYLIDFLARVRDQLMWLMLVVILWTTLDQWNPQYTLRRRQVQS